MILTVFLQVLTMFILAGLGFILFRTKKITAEASKGLGNILIFLSLPAVIINGFRVERTPDRLTGLLLSALAAAVVLALSMLISRLVLGRRALDNFAGSFSNPGFFGVPIIVASFGSGAVFYIAAFIAFLNLLQWTYGVSLLKNSDASGMLVKQASGEPTSVRFMAGLKKTLRSLLKAPFMIAIVIGLFLFFTQITLPSVISSCLNHVANLNTPLAMFTTGIYLAQTDLAAMFAKKRLYLVSLVRLLVVPAASLIILALLPMDNVELKTSLLIAAACPVGSNIAVYAQLHNRDYTYAVETVVLSTLLSIITLPLMVAVAGFVL